jgi:uncharacterized protein (TIGR00255 family)
LNVPKHLWALDARFRKLIKARIQRGRVEMQLSWETKPEQAFTLRLEPAMVAETRTMLQELLAAISLEEPLRLDHFLRFADIYISRERETPELEETWEFLSQAVTQALEVLEQMRTSEGAALTTEMHKHIDLLSLALERIKGQAEALPEIWRQKLQARVEEVIAEIGNLNDVRVAQEVAFLAERRDISEEMARLESHIVQFQETLSGRNGPVGRKLEFLLQEMLREINTIGASGSKCKISNSQAREDNGGAVSKYWLWQHGDFPPGGGRNFSELCAQQASSGRRPQRPTPC